MLYSTWDQVSTRALCNAKRKACIHTLSIVPSQWVFYPANFLNMLQLATCPWSHQLHICIKHSHTPTSLEKKNPLTYYLSTLFPPACLKWTSVVVRVRTDAQASVTSPVLHNFCFLSVIIKNYDSYGKKLLSELFFLKGSMSIKNKK